MKGSIVSCRFFQHVAQPAELVWCDQEDVLTMTNYHSFLTFQRELKCNTRCRLIRLIDLRVEIWCILFLCISLHVRRSSPCRKDEDEGLRGCRLQLQVTSAGKSDVSVLCLRLINSYCCNQPWSWWSTSTWWSTKTDVNRMAETLPKSIKVVYSGWCCFARAFHWSRWSSKTEVALKCLATDWHSKHVSKRIPGTAEHVGERMQWYRILDGYGWIRTDMDG